MQVLLVEDDLAWASTVEDMLRKSGHDCVVINKGVPAAELAKTGAYDLVVLDVGLPDLDGFEVMAVLAEAGCETPVLVQSGIIGEDRRDDVMAFGADGMLAKPYGHLELIEAMVAILTAPTTEAPEEVPASLEATLELTAEHALPEELDDILTLTPLPDDAPAASNGKAGREAPPPRARSKALVAAEIIADDGKPLPCMILNLSDGGASIRLPRHMKEPPKYLKLRMPSGDVEECRVCWRAHDKVGVKFLEE